MGVNFDWHQLWAEFKTMPDDMKAQVAKTLDGGERNGFERWLESRSPKTQVAVLDNAPDELKEHLYKHGILAPAAVFALDIRSKTKVVDRRLTQGVSRQWAR